MNKCIYAVDDFGTRICGLELVPVSEQHCRKCKQRENELMNIIRRMYKEMKRRKQINGGTYDN